MQSLRALWLSLFDGYVSIFSAFDLGEPLRVLPRRAFGTCGHARVGLFAPSPAPRFTRLRVVPLLSLSLPRPLGAGIGTSCLS
jgi:hypothetical protein